MAKFFIVISGSYCGYYGTGTSLSDARKAWHKAGGRSTDKGYRVEEFTSSLPFAPRDRQATEKEADAWVGRDGSLNWIRCERVREGQPNS